MSHTILVVEDDPTLQETLTYNLKREGYHVEAVSDGRAALEAARRLQPDIIILDLMLPHLDGFEVTRILRQEMNPIIIMLTARTDEIDRVVGLEVGADDYMIKPFSMRELLARVRAHLRRAHRVSEQKEEPLSQEKMVFGNLLIDTSRHEVTLNGQPLVLKPKEYALLLFLARHRGRVLSREFILERVWGWDYIGDSRTIDVHIRWLRQKIEENPSNPKRIVTVRGGGYRFEG
ncbi:MAG: DNA-binding response regulator [Anaerolineae bacterium]|nr:MAG: DNA-binding response regulator [Anaerolineae bacterium]